jgi:hypothetical protein
MFQLVLHKKTISNFISFQKMLLELCIINVCVLKTNIVFQKNANLGTMKEWTPSNYLLFQVI